MCAAGAALYHFPTHFAPRNNAIMARRARHNHLTVWAACGHEMSTRYATQDVAPSFAWLAEYTPEACTFSTGQAGYPVKKLSRGEERKSPLRAWTFVLADRLSKLSI